jgi:hypothetical protein
MSNINILECHREIDMKTNTDMDTHTNNEKDRNTDKVMDTDGTWGQRCLAKGPYGAIDAMAPYDFSLPLVAPPPDECHDMQILRSSYRQWAALLTTC